MKTLLSVMVGMAVACGVAMGETWAVRDPGTLDPVAKVVLSKLERTVLPKVEMTNASVEEAVDFTRVRMAEYDPDRKEEPDKRGISFVIRKPRAVAADAGGEGKEKGDVDAEGPGLDAGVKRVTCDLRNVKVLDLVAEISRQGGVDAFVTSKGIVLLEEGERPREGEVWKVVRVKRADEVRRLLETLKIAVVDFDGTSVEEALDFLRVRAAEVEAGLEEKKGVSIVERKPRAKVEPEVMGFALTEAERKALPRLTYSARDVTLGEVLREVARQARLDVYLMTGGLSFCPARREAFANEKERAGSFVEMVYEWRE